jgi:hypothetical protein
VHSNTDFPQRSQPPTSKATRSPKITAKFWITIGLLLAARSGFAPIFGPASLVQLQQNADLIVIGSASDGIRAGDNLNFTIQVNRVVKGDLTPGIPIPAIWQSNNPGVANGHGLWFLKRSTGGWSVLPVQSGWAQFKDVFIPVPTGPLPDAYAYDPTASVPDKVASEISAAIEGVPGLGLLPGLHADLLDQLNSPVIHVLYRRLSVSSSIQQRILGLSGLIRSGNTSALHSAIEAAPELSSSTVEYGILLLSIRDGFRSGDASSVVILGQAAVNTSLRVDFRQSAAHALRGIHTKDALPYLATLLYDPDIELQAEAVGGLASFANGLPIQTTAGVPSLSYLQLPDRAPYKTEDTVAHFALGDASIRYLSYWKTWWSQNKTALGY